MGAVSSIIGPKSKFIPILVKGEIEKQNFGFERKKSYIPGGISKQLSIGKPYTMSDKTDEVDGDLDKIEEDQILEEEKKYENGYREIDRTYEIRTKKDENVTFFLLS